MDLVADGVADDIDEEELADDADEAVAERSSDGAQSSSDITLHTKEPTVTGTVDGVFVINVIVEAAVLDEPVAGLF
jgi:hypothetical protein